jgi:hypothetical protein
VEKYGLEAAGCVESIQTGNAAQSYIVYRANVLHSLQFNLNAVERCSLRVVGLFIAIKKSLASTQKRSK